MIPRSVEDEESRQPGYSTATRYNGMGAHDQASTSSMATKDGNKATWTGLVNDGAINVFHAMSVACGSAATDARCRLI